MVHQDRTSRLFVERSPESATKLPRHRASHERSRGPVERHMIVLGECSNCGAGITHCDECHVMRPVDQTLFGVGVGNCFPACVSTITGIPLADIPNFCALYAGPDWYAHFQRW